MLREHDVQVLTVGQYLRPTERHLPVVRYWHPDEFKALERAAYALGFDHIAAGPLVRSSYHADEHVEQERPGVGPLAAAAWRRCNPSAALGRRRRRRAATAHRIGGAGYPDADTFGAPGPAARRGRRSCIARLRAAPARAPPHAGVLPVPPTRRELGMAAFSVAAWRSWGGDAARVAAVLRPPGRSTTSCAAPSRSRRTRAHVAATDRDRQGARRRRGRRRSGCSAHLWDAAHPHWYDYGVWAVYMTHFFVVWVVAAVLWRVIAAAVPPLRGADRGADGRRLPDVLALSGPAAVAGDRAAASSTGSCPEIGTGSASGTRAVAPTRTAGSSTRSPRCPRCTPRTRSWSCSSSGARVCARASASGSTRWPWRFALVYGGAHFVADILAGWAMARAAYALAHRGPVARHGQRRAPAG